MKQTLSLKLGQQLTMTPQLQQAIRLLQLSTLELQQEIQEALETNPMLEVMEEGGEQEATETNEPNGSDLSASAEEQSAGNPDESGADFEEGGELAQQDTVNEQIPDDLPVDTNWDDIYEPSTASGPVGDVEQDFESFNSSDETLQNHLLWQLNLTPMSDIDRAIAMAIIDAVDDSGMLSTSIEEIYSGFNPELEIELDELEAVRHRIQHFDPIGVASLDLAECLQVQLGQLDQATPWLHEATTLISKYMHLLSTRDYVQLMRKARLSEEQLKGALQLIQQLQPRPGDMIASNSAEYIAPDVLVRKLNDKWHVELNHELAPRVGINSLYASMIRRGDSSSDNTFLRDSLQEARWFLKSLQSRNETLLKVATCIVQRQRDFLEYGEEAMRPMVLHDIAERVEMHESTISRVTTNKYIHTPRGIFELKYFFSSHVSTEAGGEASSTAIRAIIRKVVAAENPRKPLSDNKIATLLSDQGINVARRTIAKYRESLHIPPSNERKQLV